MPLDPLKRGLYFETVPLFNLDQDGLHEVSVLYRLLVLGHPVIAAPVYKPDSHAIDGVPTVGDDCHIPVARSDIEGPEDSGQLCTLICLPTALQRLGDIPTGTKSVSEKSFTTHEHRSE